MAGGVLYGLFKRKKGNPPLAKDYQYIANSDRIYKNSVYLSTIKKMTTRLAIVLLLLSLLILMMLILIARPVQKTVSKPVNRNRDIVLCMDTSGSMLSANAQVSKTFSEIALNLKGERIGLVAFDNTPITVFPLTDDYGFISDKLSYLEKVFSYDINFDFSSSDEYDMDFSISRALVGTYDGQGSSVIGDGLAGCVEAFDNIDSRRSRSIILVTDNQLAGDYIISLLEAGALAKSKEIRIYGINPADYTYDSYGGDIVYPDEVAEFRQLTINTGGNYYPLESVGTIPNIISLIEAQETARIEGSPQIIYNDKPSLFIGLSAFSIVVIYLISWRLRL